MERAFHLLDDMQARGLEAHFCFDSLASLLQQLDIPVATSINPHLGL